MNLDNKNNSVLITGGTQGLGFEIANQLIENGCSEIIIAGRNKKKGIIAEKKLFKKNVKVKYIMTDLRNAQECHNLIVESLKYFPKLNSLVNSAAVTSRGTIDDTSTELWEEHMNVNLRAPFLLMQGLIKKLKKNKEPGSIVNIASTSSYVGQSFLTAYSTSKGGLLTLSKNTALALRKDKIRVNVVAPGWMNTPGEDEIQKKYHGASDDWVKKAEKTLPMGELVNPKKLAPLVCYLLSFSSGIITGSIINYDQQIVGAVPE